jgi:hypothetical protein
MRGPNGLEVRSYDSGSVGRETIKRRQDALRAAQAAASRGERFVFVYHQSGQGAVEMLPYCPAPGDAIAPNGGKGCGRGDIGDGLYCPEHLADHHPHPETVPCPGCGAEPGEDCVVTFGKDRIRQHRADGTPWLMLWCHEERHESAITMDGRTCAGQASMRAEASTGYEPMTLF